MVIGYKISYAISFKIALFVSRLIKWMGAGWDLDCTKIKTGLPGFLEKPEMNYFERIGKHLENENSEIDLLHVLSTDGKIKWKNKP